MQALHLSEEKDENQKFPGSPTGQGNHTGWLTHTKCSHYAKNQNYISQQSNLVEGQFRTQAHFRDRRTKNYQKNNESLRKFFFMSHHQGQQGLMIATSA